MKRNIYNCGTCGNPTHTQNRDNGATPMMMPCVHCGKPAFSQFFRCDQETKQNPDIIFIKPKNEAEWELIKSDIREKIESTPDMKNQNQKQKDGFFNQIMEGIRTHVEMGGICDLKFSEKLLNNEV